MRLSLILLFSFSVFRVALAGGPGQPDFNTMGVYALLEVAEHTAWRDLDSAFIINDLALAKARKAKDWVGAFYTYRERGFYLEKYNRPLPASEEYKTALGLLDSLPEAEKKKYQPIAFNDLAIVSRKCGRYVEAKDYHEHTLQIALANGDKEMEEDSYHGIGFLYETLGEWEKAIEWYQKSVAVAELRGSREGVIISFQNIANVLLKSGHNDLAISRIESAWQLAFQLPDSARQAHVLYDFGEILSASERLPEALAKFQSALIWYENLGDKPMIGRSLHSIAKTYAEKGDDKLALEFFKKGLHLKESIRPENLVKLYFDLGELYQKRHNLREAEQAFSESLRLAQQYNFRDFLQKTHFALGQLARQNGNSAAALEHLNASMQLADSLRNSQTERRIVELEFRYQADQAEKMIQLLRARTDKILLGSGLVALLLLCGFLLYLFRQKVKTNYLLKDKNAEIERRNQQLNESNEVLRQFAYATAHDLKEPLRTIGSFVGLLQKKHSNSFPPEAIEYFNFVKMGALRMNTMLSELLEYSTVFMDSPGQDKTDISAGLREVMSNLQEAVRQHKAVVELPLELPRQLVRISQSHFIQLFQNLIGNAIKFSPDNPRVIVSVQRDADGFFCFSVKDFGIGIDKNYEEKIFQIFQRLDRQRFEGAGIGLAICKNIVEKYGGAIWFDSEVGKGTTFFIRLPIDDFALGVGTAAGENEVGTPTAFHVN